jgi:hypothetical protein
MESVRSSGNGLTVGGSLRESAAIPALLDDARRLLDDPELTKHKMHRLGTMLLAALVATCPAEILPEEYRQARIVLRPGSGADRDQLRAVCRAALADLEQGHWAPDEAWIVEAALAPLGRLLERDTERRDTQ